MLTQNFNFFQTSRHFCLKIRTTRRTPLSNRSLPRSKHSRPRNHRNTNPKNRNQNQTRFLRDRRSEKRKSRQNNEDDEAREIGAKSLSVRSVPIRNPSKNWIRRFTGEREDIRASSKSSRPKTSTQVHHRETTMKTQTKQFSENSRTQS